MNLISPINLLIFFYMFMLGILYYLPNPEKICFLRNVLLGETIGVIFTLAHFWLISWIMI